MRPQPGIKNGCANVSRFDLTKRPMWRRVATPWSGRKTLKKRLLTLGLAAFLGIAATVAVPTATPASAQETPFVPVGPCTLGGGQPGVLLLNTRSNTTVCFPLAILRPR